MNTKLAEGLVIKSNLFVNGNERIPKVFRVGNFDDKWIYEKTSTYGVDEIFYSNGTPAINKERSQKEYLVLSVVEKNPQIGLGNRTSEYNNLITAIELSSDGTYDETNPKIEFSTAYVGCGQIVENDIKVVRQMKKTYI